MISYFWHVTPVEKLKFANREYFKDETKKNQVTLNVLMQSLSDIERLTLPYIEYSRAKKWGKVFIFVSMIMLLVGLAFPKGLNIAILIVFTFGTFHVYNTNFI